MARTVLKTLSKLTEVHNPMKYLFSHFADEKLSPERVNDLAKVTVAGLSFKPGKFEWLCNAYSSPPVMGCENVLEAMLLCGGPMSKSWRGFIWLLSVHWRLRSAWTTYEAFDLPLLTVTVGFATDHFGVSFFLWFVLFALLLTSMACASVVTRGCESL